MMPEVVHAKAHRACRKVWQIGEDRDPEVQALVAKDQVMRGVMNNDIVGVISESAYEICNQATEPPIMKAEPAHRVGNDVCKMIRPTPIAAVPGLRTINSRTSGWALTIARVRAGCG